MRKIIIAAVGKNYVIGNEGKIPWNVPVDLKHFQDTTAGGVLLMGRATHDSITVQLTGRPRVVLSRSKEVVGGDSVVGGDFVSSFDEAYDWIREVYSGRDCYIIGGEDVFRQAIPDADEMIITHIGENYDGDRYFPVEYGELDEDWVVKKTHLLTDNIAVKYYKRR